ncbi:DUF4189 domain-containing protein [Aggregatibacter actinomycetemcomitans]|nr:DUF4189 domain-containing protein [Aggregatibacter actinomycetemcomitans]
MRRFMMMAMLLLSALSYAKEDVIATRPQPPKRDFPMYWSTIAYNPENGAFGYGDNSMQKATENNALKGCMQASNGGNAEGCRIVISANHACVALAVGQQTQDYAVAQSTLSKPEAAEQKALQECNGQGKNCSVVLSACGK